jgi:microcystin-dependent protein
MSPEAYIGEIALFAGADPKDNNWLPCDGRTMQASVYAGLYAVIGNAFGGTPNQTFNLPDLRGRVPVGAGKASSGTTYTLGQAGGSATATIGMNQLPQHTHGLGNISGGVIMASSHLGTTNTPDSTNNTIAAAFDPNGSTNMVYNSDTPNIPWNTGSEPVTLSTAGSGNPFSVMQTYMNVGFYICAIGQFPDPQ